MSERGLVEDAWLAIKRPLKRWLGLDWLERKMRRWGIW